MDDSLSVTPRRLVVEGEQLVLNSVSARSLDLVSLADFRRNGWTLRHSRKRSFWQTLVHCFENIPDRSHPAPVVWVPSRTHLIVKAIPSSLQQRYGLEKEEGAIFLRPDIQDGSSQGELRFNNGAVVQLQELRDGQLMEVLSLAGTQPTLYEPELQVK